jgi:serine/threonine protein kinase
LRAVDDTTARHDDVKRHYEFGREIGRGGCTVVMEAIKKGTNERYAVKYYKKSDIQRDNIGLLHTDLQRWKALDHPNIVKVRRGGPVARPTSNLPFHQLYDVFESKEEFFLVEELVDGKELFDKIVESGNYSEKRAANIVRQMVSALRYLHERGLAHR